MPRRKEVTKRKILPDPKYNDWLVTKFVNNLMKDGKKNLVERVFYYPDKFKLNGLSQKYLLVI